MKAFAEQFKQEAWRLTRNLRHREIIQTALRKYEVGRDKSKAAFQDWQAARQAASETKWEAINHLDQFLLEFVEKIEARGTRCTGPAPGYRPETLFWASFAKRRPAPSSSPRR